VLSAFFNAERIFSRFRDSKYAKLGSTAAAGKRRSLLPRAIEITCIAPWAIARHVRVAHRVCMSAVDGAYTSVHAGVRIHVYTRAYARARR